MEIVVAPPQQVLWFVIGLPVLIAALVLAAGAVKRTPWPHLVAPIVLAVGASGVVYHWALRPMVFAWDEAGLRDQSFGAEVRIPWSEVNSARVVPLPGDGVPPGPAHERHGIWQLPQRLVHPGQRGERAGVPDAGRLS